MANKKNYETLVKAENTLNTVRKALWAIDVKDMDELRDMRLVIDMMLNICLKRIDAVCYRR
jgi:hypothetical protein